MLESSSDVPLVLHIPLLLLLFVAIGDLRGGEIYADRLWVSGWVGSVFWTIVEFHWDGVLDEIPVLRTRDRQRVYRQRQQPAGYNAARPITTNLMVVILIKVKLNHHLQTQSDPGAPSFFYKKMAQGSHRG